MDQGVIVLVITDGVLRNGMQSYIVQQSNGQDVKVFATLKAFEKADICLVDVLFLDENSVAADKIIETTARLTKRCPVVLLSQRLQSDYVRQILQAGAQGFIYRDGFLQESVPGAVRVVKRGVVYISPRAAALLTTSSLLWNNLSPRAKHVLKMMSEGMTVKEIARDLKVTPKTIYRDRERLREALNVGTNEQIVAEAQRQGLV